MRSSGGQQDPKRGPRLPEASGREDAWGIPDWIDGEAYRELLRVDRQLLAWEWLRRDPGYRRAAVTGGRALGEARPGAGDPAAARWGLHAFEDPCRPAPLARPIWTASATFVLVARAMPSERAADSFDLAALGPLATVVLSDIGEHLLLSDGRHCLRLDILEGSLFEGPVLLHYCVSGLRSARLPVRAIETLRGLVQPGRFAPGNGGRRVRPRDVLLLRAFDGIRRGACQRRLAEQLFGRGELGAGWRIDQPSLRSQVQRLARDARATGSGGFRNLLSNDAAALPDCRRSLAGTRQRA